jgi:S-adenosylmethionine hydrolase
VAARLADGLPLDATGTPVDIESLAGLELPEVRRHRDGLTATALLVDRFGNVTLNLRARQLEEAKLGDDVELICGAERFLARVASTFSSVRPSDIVVLVDSYGQAAIAVNAGSAVEVLGLEPGDQVRLRRLG